MKNLQNGEFARREQTGMTQPQRSDASLRRKTEPSRGRQSKPRLAYEVSADRDQPGCTARPLANRAKKSEPRDCRVAAGLWSRPRPGRRETIPAINPTGINIELAIVTAESEISNEAVGPG